MKRLIRVTLAALTAVSLLILAGCAATDSEKPESTGGMGMSPEGVWGYVADAKFAQLEIDPEQMDVDVLSVDRVLAPTDAWLVVHLSEGGKPGPRVGLAHVEKGESLDVAIELEDVTTPDVIVALHADKGDAGVFDFDMDKMMESPDRPFFVDEKELAVVVNVRPFGIPVATGEASIELDDQVGAKDEIVIKRVVSPEDAWLVVHLENDGMPGARVGYLAIPAGESVDVRVKLTGEERTDRLLVAVHADRGDRGVLDFDMMAPVGSPDQPFFVDGVEVAAPLRVK